MFHPATWTITYVVHNGPGNEATITDSVLDYDSRSDRLRHTSAAQVIQYVRANDFKVK